MYVGTRGQWEQATCPHVPHISSQNSFSKSSNPPCLLSFPLFLLSPSLLFSLLLQQPLSLCISLFPGPTSVLGQGALRDHIMEPVLPGSVRSCTNSKELQTCFADCWTNTSIFPFFLIDLPDKQQLSSIISSYSSEGHFVHTPHGKKICESPGKRGSWKGAKTCHHSLCGYLALDPAQVMLPCLLDSAWQTTLGRNVCAAIAKKVIKTLQ